MTRVRFWRAPEIKNFFYVEGWEKRLGRHRHADQKADPKNANRIRNRYSNIYMERQSFLNILGLAKVKIILEPSTVVSLTAQVQL